MLGSDGNFKLLSLFLPYAEAGLRHVIMCIQQALYFFPFFSEGINPPMSWHFGRKGRSGGWWGREEGLLEEVKTQPVYSWEDVLDVLSWKVWILNSKRWRALGSLLNCLHQSGCWRIVTIYAQSCLTLCDPRDCSPPGFTDHSILQARTLEWVAISFSWGSYWLTDWTHVSCVSCSGRQILYYYITWETPKNHE